MSVLLIFKDSGSICKFILFPQFIPSELFPKSNSLNELLIFKASQIFSIFIVSLFKQLLDRFNAYSFVLSFNKNEINIEFAVLFPRKLFDISNLDSF